MFFYYAFLSLVLSVVAGVMFVLVKDQDDLRWHGAYLFPWIMGVASGGAAALTLIFG